MIANELLIHVYELINLDKRFESTDILVDELDNMFLTGNFADAKKLLSQIELDKLVPSVITGVLTITWHAKMHLGESREIFYQDCISILESKWKYTPEQLDRLAKRLK